MSQLTKIILIALPVLLLSSCASINVSEYKELTPVLKPQKFFSGALTAHGVVKNRSGKVIRTFNADLIGSWENGVGTLEEDFVFNDGEEQRRVWTLKPDADGNIMGTAGDVVGDAEGAFAGNSMFLKYTLRIPYDGDTIDVNIDDRMYLVNDTTLINESKMKKFGFRVGQILLVIQKVE